MHARARHSVYRVWFCSGVRPLDGLGVEQGWQPIQGQVPSLWTSPRWNRVLLFLPAPEPSDVLRDEPMHLKKTSCFQQELPSVRCSHQGRWWQHQDHSPPSGETGGCLKAVSSMPQPCLTARQFRNGTRGRGPWDRVSLCLCSCLSLSPTCS